ncbi:MAG: ABC transporter ATP-binding protein, partial [Lentisphaerae bacterium]|nr:ABC transporter ATP-binding protein [Lentisphaerota bacterium]
MAQVEIQCLQKSFRGPRGTAIHAVRNLDLSVADSEFLVLLGPSGCGKSTVLRLIAGLETVTEGTIAIGGQVVNDLPPKERDVAMVFQNYALYPHMTVFDNLAFGLRMHQVPTEVVKHRVLDAAEMLGLSALLNRKPAS